MKKDPGLLTDLITLSPSEDIPADIIKENESTYFVSQCGRISLLKNHPLHSVYYSLDPNNSEVKKIYEQYVGENKLHDPKMVYVVRENRFKIPKDTFRYVMKYFREIYAKHKTESAVLLMVNATTKDWKVLFVPQVNSSTSSVKYLTPRESYDNSIREHSIAYKEIFEDEEKKALMLRSYKEYNDLTRDGYMIYGTIHSHSNFGAFHSGTDDHDETDFDGLHITIGNVDKDFSFSSRYILATAPFPHKAITEVVDVDSVAELVNDIDSVQIDEYHMNLMMPGVGRSHFYSGYNGQSWGYSPNNHHGYQNTHKSNAEWLEEYRKNNSGHNQKNNDVTPFTETELAKNSITEQSAWRIRDHKDNRTLWVRIGFYNLHRKYFDNTERFTILPDPPWDFKEEKKTKPTSDGTRVKKEKTTKITLINDPRYNDNYEWDAPSKLYIAQEIQSANSKELAIWEDMNEDFEC